MKNRKISLKNLSAMLIILLIAGFIAPLSTTVAGNGNGSSQGEQTGTAVNSTASPNAGSDSNQNGNTAASGPNTSDNAKQYNKTTVTPKNQMEQVRAQEQTMFQFRNMTMVMNCTRNCNVTFTADEEVTPKAFGLSVDPNQTMTLSMNLTESPLNGALVNERCLNFYLGIEPNAVLQLQAQIRLRINQTELSQSLNREVNASRLTWMYWNQTRAQWETVQSYMDQNGDLVCNTNHFSTWTVAEVDPAEESASSNQTIIPIEYTGIGAVVAIAVIALGFVAYKKRK